MELKVSVILVVGYLTVVSADRLRSTCTDVGLDCAADNTAVLLCIKTPTGFQEVNVEECGAGYHCSYVTKQCVPETYKCHQQGVFPDPYDCHKYYYCGEVPSGETEYDGEVNYCIKYYHFDVLTGQCQQYASPGECENGAQLVPQCTAPAQSGPLEANANYYYVCAKTADGHLYPKVFKCADKQYYDAVKKECVQEL
ncbi:uncharacterized protein [Periplaneta americana]|uniref:uncharacterized protein n=1 Tax=Periplaneta americana TaxID=6978 RepID=UPI0037E876FC